MQRNGYLLSSLAAAAACVFWGGTVVAVRFVIDQTDPYTVALLRHGIGTTLMLPVLALVSVRRIAARDLLPIAALGVAMFGLFSYFSAGGLAYIPAARGALILTTMPLLTVVFAALLRIERLTVPKLAGIALTIGGVAVALSGHEGLADTGPTGTRRGDAYMFAAAAFGALYNTFTPRYLHRYPPLLVTLYSMLGGTAFLAVLGLPLGVYAQPLQFTTAGWAAIAFIGAFGAAASFFLWVWALRRMPPSHVVAFFALNPLTATLLGGLLLGERVTVWFLLGLTCVLGGIWVVHRDRAPPARRG